MMFTVKAMPGMPMTKREIERQLNTVCALTEATEYFTEDELEAYPWRTQTK